MKSKWFKFIRYLLSPKHKLADLTTEQRILWLALNNHEIDRTRWTKY